MVSGPKDSSRWFRENFILVTGPVWELEERVNETRIIMITTEGLATVMPGPICCSARNSAHVGDLYPASSNSSLRLVFFPIVAINTCSWSFQHICFSRKFLPPLVIVHPRPGSRHHCGLHRLIVFVCCLKLVSQFLSYIPGVCAPPFLLILV